jgi:hypothetical protein
MSLLAGTCFFRLSFAQINQAGSVWELERKGKVRARSTFRTPAGAMSDRCHVTGLELWIDDGPSLLNGLAAHSQPPHRKPLLIAPLAMGFADRHCTITTSAASPPAHP